jgi:GC-rich sequence DNA-binding factor
MVARRRREDDEDDLSLFLYIPPADSSDQVDDLGRSLPTGPHSATRIARRASRDARNIASRISALRGPPLPAKLLLSQEDQEGYYTDSELPSSDMQDYTLARGKFSHRVSSLLSDVKSEEFRDPVLGLGRRFTEWREKWAESYTGAWGGLGLVGTWEFWARLEMAEWDPLEVSSSVSLRSVSGILFILICSWIGNQGSGFIPLVHRTLRLFSAAKWVYNGVHGWESSRRRPRSRI